MDVGCYNGHFLSLLPDRVKKIGIDIDEQFIAQGREQYGDGGIQFFAGDFETFANHGPSPDTITMFHALEHLPNPIKVLENLRSTSLNTTRLVVEVPILENGLTKMTSVVFSRSSTRPTSAEQVCGTVW